MDIVVYKKIRNSDGAHLLTAVSERQVKKLTGANASCVLRHPVWRQMVQSSLCVSVHNLSVRRYGHSFIFAT